MKIGTLQPEPLAVYIHWPFCRAKCPYCDFNSHVRPAVDQAQWRAAYRQAIEHYAKLTEMRHIGSVYFGGGTPSLMEPQTVETILSALSSHWRFADNIEITLEANPTSIETDKFIAFRNAGINRVSIGVQALNDQDLSFFGREHSAADGLRAVETAGNIFKRFSFDLMYARPNQTPAQWEAELLRALDHAGAGHLSLYQLTIERTTPFYFAHEKGEFAMPSDTLAADFYLQTQAIMEARGLPAYEVSNHARPGEESRHNMTYWTYGDYLGIGPDAHGRITAQGIKRATREHAAPEIWLEKVTKDGHARHPDTILTPRDRFLETLMMGLRLRTGIATSVLEEHAEAKFETLFDRGKLLKALEENLIHDWRDTERLTATTEGWLKLNSLIPFVMHG